MSYEIQLVLIVNDDSLFSFIPLGVSDYYFGIKGRIIHHWLSLTFSYKFGNERMILFASGLWSHHGNKFRTY